MKRIRRVLLLTLLFVIMAPFLWLTMTQSGLRWILHKATASYSDIVHYENVKGTLAGNITVSRLVISSAGYNVSLENAEFQTQLRRLLFGQLYITSFAVKAVTVTPPVSEAPEPAASSKPIDFNVVLPISINVKSARIDRLTMDMESPYLPSHAQVLLENLKIHRRVLIGNLSVSSTMGKLILRGELPLSLNDSLAVSLAADLTAPTLKQPVVGTLTLSGNYTTINVQSSLTSPDPITLRGKVSSILSSPQWNVSLESPKFKLQHWADGSDFLFSNIKLTSKGEIKNYQIAGSGQFSDKSTGSLAFTISANQANNAWTIKNLNLSNKKTTFALDMSGTINTAYDFNTKTQARLIAGWKNIQWPMAGNSPDMLSRKGSADFTGSITQYSLKAAGDFNAGKHKFQDILLSGTGNADELALDSLTCTYLDGTWSGSGVVNWKNGVLWQTSLSVKNADIGHIVKDIRSNLAANITLSGSVVKQHLQFSSSIQQLTGQVNGYPINGKAGIAYSNVQLTVSQADISSKSNHLHTDFTLNTAADTGFPITEARWTVNARNLSELYPQLGGKLTSKGNFSTVQNVNIVQGTLRSENLRYKTYSTEQFSLKIETGKDNMANLSASGKNINIDNYKVRDFSLNGKGTLDNPVLNLRAHNDKNASLTLKTNISRQNSQWQVILAELAVDNTAMGNWSLTTQPQAIFTSSGFSMDPLCIQKRAGKDTFCLSTKATSYQKIDSNITIKHLDLNNFKDILPANILSVSGELNGDAEAHFRDGNFSLSRMNLVSAKGLLEISTDITVKDQFEYQNIDLTLSKSDKLYNVTFSTHIIEAGYIKSQVTFSSAYISSGDWKNNKLSGYLDVNFENLEKLSLILPMIANARGKWTSHFSFSGTLSNPILVGKSTLDIDSVDLPVSGITIKKLNLVTRSEPDNTLLISGMANSGEGKLGLDGKLRDYSLDKFTGTMKISGDHFKIANLPEISVVVSPDLNFTLSEKQADLEGNLTINEADIKILSQITTMSPSSDVVIVTQPKEQSNAYPSIDFVSNVRVTLGNKVWLRGYGFEGRLEGSILVKQRPGELTKASGNINIVDGNYSAYGRSLHIDNGALNFAGNPIDNPSINIRATRKIGDNDNTVVAGLMITGQAQSPTIKLFSEPAMEDADILSYIVLGVPLKQASQKDGAALSQAAASIGLLGAEKLVKRYAKYFGIDEVKVQSNTTTQEASLVLGKYLSPNLYMSYAIGVGQAINTFQLQYKLSEHWVLKTESGISKAADILFTIEK